MADNSALSLALAGPSSQKRSLNRQVVLEEEEYTEALEHIIARDFYPSLVHLDATNEYLEAVESQDTGRIGASVRRLEQISSTPVGATPFDTPRNYVGDTPSRTPMGEPLSKRRKYDSSLSLDKFQARYTSEDNSSFTEILDDENSHRKEIYGWAFDAEMRAKGRQLKVEQGRERMLIEGGHEESRPGVRQKFLIEQPQPAGLITASGEEEGEKPKPEQSLVLLPDQEDSEVVDVMAPKKDTRIASVDGWDFTARNSLMFGPDANVSPYQLPAHALVPDPKFVAYESTRLAEQDESTSAPGSSVPPSPSRSRVEAAITNVPYQPSSASDGSFTLVPNLPSPTPAELGAKGVQQLMTLGTLSATPRIISRGDEPSTPFKIAQPSTRESLSHRLANDARKSLRSKANVLSGVRSVSRRKGDMGPPSCTPRKSAGSLTPAARSLLERSTFGTAGTRRGHVMDKWKEDRKEQDLAKVRWTPTPVRK